MINGIPSLAYTGVNSPNPPNFMSLNRAPTTNDTNFPIGTIWLNEATSAVYMLVKFPIVGSTLTALWTQLASGSTGTLTIKGNSSDATENANGEINVFGDALNITTSGDGVNTLTIALEDDLEIDSIDLPNTSESFGVGFISFNSIPAFHNYVNGFIKSNIFVGNDAGNANALLDGGDNSALGFQALNALESGTDNVAIGSAAALALTDSSGNCAVGSAALTSLVDGVGGNCAFGGGALRSLVDGVSNIAIGTGAGSAYDGSQLSNIAISNIGLVGDNNVIRIGTQGNAAGEQNACYIAGIWNTNIDPVNQAVLIDANGQLGTGPAGTVTFDIIDLPNTAEAFAEGVINFGGTPFIHNYANDATKSNTFVGGGAGNAAAGLTGIGNTVVGYQSATAITTGIGNTFIGSLIATGPIVTGGANVALGSSIYANLTSGELNCAIGSRTASSSLRSITTGSYNIGINGATAYTGAESSNICIGAAGTLGESNVMRLGTDGSGDEQIDTTYIAGTVTTARDITATTGNITVDQGNVIVGSVSNDANANAVAFFKDRAGGVILPNDKLGALDFRGFDGSAFSPSAAIDCIATGAIAAGQVPGTLNFYTTPGTGGNPVLRTTIDENGTITTEPGAGETDAIIVTAGDVTLSNGDLIVTDGNLTVDGATSVVTLVNVPGTVVANSVALLIDSTTGEVGTSGTLTNLDTFGNTVGVTGIPVVVDNAGEFGTVVSSRRYKDNIKDMGDQSSPIMNLRPVTFTMKRDLSQTCQWGLIAEEVADILPNIVGYNDEGNPEYVRYHDLPCMLLNELQKQQRVIADLLNRVKLLEDSSSVN